MNWYKKHIKTSAIPHGYWISPMGDIYNVSYQKHDIAAMEISINKKIIPLRGLSAYDYYENLLSKGYVKITNPSSEDIVKKMIIHFIIEPNSSQRRIIEDLSKINESIYSNIEYCFSGLLNDCHSNIKELQKAI